MPRVPSGNKKVFAKIEPFLYLFPAIFFFGVFTYFPFFKTIYKSFFLTNSMGVIREFVGFENYKSVLSNDVFLKAIVNTLKFVFSSIPLAIGIALVLAVLANKKTRTSSIYETLFALTMAMSMSVTAMIFQLMYNPSVGILNYLLGTDINWLNDSRVALFALSFINVWLNIGFNFIFLLAAIRGISTDIIESATIDGAGSIRKTVSIILPMVSPMVFFLIVSALAKNMMMSGLVLVLTQGGPQDSTQTMISFMYQQAVNNFNYNDAFASAIVSFILTFSMILLGFIYEKKGVFYS